jgi:hypothetical protein
MPHGAGCPIHRACCDEWEELPQSLSQVSKPEGAAFMRTKKAASEGRYRSAEGRNGARNRGPRRACSLGWSSAE